jgi:hypothetical protein
MRILLPTLAAGLAACSMVVPSSDQVPSFRVDPAWPRPLPEENGVQLVLGQVAGIAVDERNGHVWIIRRPATLLADEWNAKESRPVTHRCCKSVPPVAEFDAAGNYVRGWAPSDPKAQWPKVEHGIYIDPEGNVWLSNDGKAYLCDRVNDRIQVFEPSGKFLQEMRVEPLTPANGSVWDMVLSHDAAKKFMYVADGAQVSSFGRTGRMAGEFKWVHNIAIDRQGNLYTSEVGFGRRVQKFVLLSF